MLFEVFKVQFLTLDSRSFNRLEAAISENLRLQAAPLPWRGP